MRDCDICHVPDGINRVFSAEPISAKAADIADIAELAAIELRTALAELGAISGQIVTEDILARIFSRFCIGK